MILTAVLYTKQNLETPIGRGHGVLVNILITRRFRETIKCSGLKNLVLVPNGGKLMKFWKVLRRIKSTRCQLTVIVMLLAGLHTRMSSLSCKHFVRYIYGNARLVSFDTCRGGCTGGCTPARTPAPTNTLARTLYASTDTRSTPIGPPAGQLNSSHENSTERGVARTCAIPILQPVAKLRR